MAQIIGYITLAIVSGLAVTGVILAMFGWLDVHPEVDKDEE